MVLKVVGSGSSGNCYILSDGSEQFIIDCGCSYRQILKGLDYNVENVCGVIVSHNHVDHIASAHYFTKVHIPVFGNEEVASSCDGITKIDQFKKIRCGSFEFVGFQVPHTSIDKENNCTIPCMNFGFLITNNSIGKLLYVTDFEYIKYSFVLHKLDHILIECNHDDINVASGYNRKHVMEGHSALNTVQKFLEHNKTSNLKNVILCHISRDNATPSVMYDVISRSMGKDVSVNLAQPGLVVNLKE